MKLISSTSAKKGAVTAGNEHFWGQKQILWTDINRKNLDSAAINQFQIFTGGIRNSDIQVIV